MHTLISAFVDRAGAERAVERLHELGFAPDDVHLQEHHDIGGGDKGDLDNDRGLLPSYGRAFAGAQSPAEARHSDNMGAVNHSVKERPMKFTQAALVASMALGIGFSRDRARKQVSEPLRGQTQRRRVTCASCPCRSAAVSPCRLFRAVKCGAARPLPTA